MVIEGTRGEVEKVCNYRRRWETCEPAKTATGENVVLFMTRSVVDKDCGFFRDKIVTTDTQKETDKGGFGALYV